MTDLLSSISQVVARVNNFHFSGCQDLVSLDSTDSGCADSLPFGTDLTDSFSTGSEETDLIWFTFPLSPTLKANGQFSDFFAKAMD